MRKQYLLMMLACLFGGAGTGWSVTRYVSTDGANISPYTNWADAATNIARVLVPCVDGDVVIVSNGVHYCSYVQVNPSITIRSLNGPEVTSIDCNRAYGIILYNNSILDGFTYTNGSNLFSASMLLYSNSVAQNCRFINNWAYRGGAVAMNTGSMLSNCLFAGNTGSNRAGAVYVLGGTGFRIYDCTFYNNLADYSADGGAIYALGSVECRNLLMYSNQSANGYGGAIYGNSNTYLYNCTIAYNACGTQGGGVYGAIRAANCIIYTNYAAGSVYSNWSSSAFFTNCCIGWQSSPAISGVNNFTNAPLFADPVAGNFRLASGSPCIDSGVNLDWMAGALDLARRPRINPITGVADRGAYESAPIITLFQVH